MPVDSLTTIYNASTTQMPDRNGCPQHGWSRIWYNPDVHDLTLQHPNFILLPTAMCRQERRGSAIILPPAEQRKSVNSTSNLNNRPCFRFLLLQSRRREPVVQSGLVGTTRIRVIEISDSAWLRWKNQRGARPASILCPLKLESYPQRAPADVARDVRPAFNYRVTCHGNKILLMLGLHIHQDSKMSCQHMVRVILKHTACKAAYAAFYFAQDAATAA